MNETIVARWNADVSSKDTVYILGDFAWKRHHHWVSVLNGHKILVVGTHDKMPRSALDLFTEVHPGVLKRNVGGHPMYLSHCPALSWDGKPHGVWNLHGHSHASLVEEPTVFRHDISMEAYMFRPAPLGVIEVIMEQRKWVPTMSPKEYARVVTERRYKLQCAAVAAREIYDARQAAGKMSEQCSTIMEEGNESRNLES